MPDTINHKYGSAGGYLVGEPHSNNGIKAYNKSTDKFLEMEGGEVVITKPAVSDNTKRQFQGEMLTNRQILSRINESGGGVSFADGGEIPSEMYYYGTMYEFGGETMSDKDIINHISSCGCDHEYEYKYGGSIDDAETEPINKTPDNIQELSKALTLAKMQERPKKETSDIQEYFFRNYVINNPPEITQYLKAIRILPENKREYFPDMWMDEYYNQSGPDSFLKKLGDNPYYAIPDDFIKFTPPKKILFQFKPDNSGLDKIITPFTSEDALRPQLSGVYFNVQDESVYATNAHILLYLKGKPEVSESSICIMPSTKKWFEKNVEPLHMNEDMCLRPKDVNYPVIHQIINTNIDHVISVSTEKLLKYCIVFGTVFASRYTGEMLISFKKDNAHVEIGVNRYLLTNCLMAMMELGNETVDFCFGASAHKAVTIVPKGNSRKIMSGTPQTDFALFMPFNGLDTKLKMLNYAPVYDLDNNEPTNMWKLSGMPAEAERYEFNISEIDDYPRALELIRDMSESKLKKNLSGSCSTNYHLSSRSYNCEYILRFSDPKKSPPDSYRIVVVDSTYGDSKDAKIAAEDRIQEALAGNKNITDAIEGLKIVMIGADTREQREIYESIQALKLMLPESSRYFAKGGALDAFEPIETPLGSVPNVQAIMVENL